MSSDVDLDVVVDVDVVVVVDGLSPTVVHVCLQVHGGPGDSEGRLR